MIYNIVPLPKRKLCGSVSTMQPIFVRKDVLEDAFGFGCDYDLDGLNDFNKYKTIERVGDYIVERIIYSEEPLFHVKKWWEAHLPMYPIWTKMYEVPFKPQATVYRYLEGSAHLSSCGNNEHPITQTIFRPINQQIAMIGAEDLLEDDAHRLSEFVVPGDDEYNIMNCTSSKSFIDQVWSNDMDIEDFIECYSYSDPVPRYLPDPYHDLFGKCPTANQLKPLLSTRYFGTPMIELKDPFAINAKTEVDYDVQLAQGTIKELMLELENSGYTDIQMSVRRTNDNKISLVSDMSIMYLGPSAIYSRTDFVNEKKRLEQIFMSFASAIMTQFPNPIGVSLIKTWNEEVFVILHINDHEDDKWFFDLAALSIASPSFTDYNGI